MEEIDCYWMANAKGVDHALHYAKMWSKYAKGRIASQSIIFILFVP